MLADWASVKSLLTGRSLSAQYVTVGSNYWIKAIDGAFELECLLPTDTTLSADSLDFVTNFKTAGNQQLKQTVVQQLGADSVSICPFGTMFDAPANTTTTYDLRITSTIFLKGGIMYAAPGNVGDTITVEVVDKDNVTGLGANTVLASYVNNWYVIPEDMNAVEDVSLSQPMMAGLYIRFIYVNAHATQDTKVVVNLLAYQGTP